MKKAMKEIGVTTHAKQRLKERFYGKFKKYFQDDWMLENLFIAQLRTARKMECWKRHPFYVNRMAIQYGPHMEVYYKSGVYFVVREYTKKIQVLTVIPRFLYYK